MGKRGAIEIRALARGELEAGQTWVVYAPTSIKRSAEELRRVRLRVEPVPARQGDEIRPLHAKLLRWRRTGAKGAQKDLLLAGSSNATAAGFGIGNAPRNIEAGICFVSNDELAAEKWFDEAFPAAVKADKLLLRPPVQNDDEAGITPPVPQFFAWAVVQRRGSSGEYELTIGFDRTKNEPAWWLVEVVGFADQIGHEEYAGMNRPQQCRIVRDIQGQPLPDVIAVHWRSGESKHNGLLPVNARGECDRCNQEIWSELDLETMLEILAHSGPWYRSLVSALRLGSRMPGGQGVEVELDPHRRVDMSQFLLQRTRRISRALEGLRERLAAPVLSANALEWRFGGPISPRAVARRMAESYPDPVDRTFVLTELAMVVGRARRQVEPIGVEATMVDASFNKAIDEIESMLPNSKQRGDLAGYVTRAFAQARR
jgi:hypothetical protein